MQLRTTAAGTPETERYTTGPSFSSNAQYSMMKPKSEDPPTALAAFMTELKASNSVVGLVDDNPRTNASPIPIMTVDSSNNEKGTQRWIPIEHHSQRGIDKILRTSGSSSSSIMPSLEEGIRLVSSATDPQSESTSTIGAPFKPQRRNSPIPTKVLLEEAEEVSSTTNIPDNDHAETQEPSAGTTMSPSYPDPASEAAPTRPRRKQSIDSQEDAMMSP